MTGTGHDPARLARIAPTELRPGEDPVERFVREAEAVQTQVLRTDRAGVTDMVVAALRTADVTTAALAADLAPYDAGLADALAAAGVTARAYAEVAGDREAMRTLEATITGCVAAVAATGSIVTGARAGRGAALVAPVHVCVVERSRLLDGMLALFRALPDLGAGSMVALQSGPSRTADIEKTLILGMHGPRAVHVVLVEDA